MNKLTVLTRPVSLVQAIFFKVRNLLRFFQRSISGRVFDWDVVKYGGHPAVSRSLVTGLKRIGASFNFNPVKLEEVGEMVVVLSSVEALKQAILWKKSGKISKLLAGPNLMELPNDHGNILASPEIDAVLVPSQMAAEIYEKFSPTLKGRIKVWYAGVDEAYWKPPASKGKKQEVLVYWKNAPKTLGIYAERLLKKYGFELRRIVFGRYTKSQYKRVLSKSAFAVFLSVTETQGLALVEAWAMGVPTLVWNPKIEHYYIKNLQTTAAPYLSESTGREWKELSELEQLLEDQGWLKVCQPRQWVLQHMTDEKSAKMLLELCGRAEKPQNLPLKKPYAKTGQSVKLSVCIPTYTYQMKDGGVQFFEHSLNLLAKQTFKDFEVMITDDSVSDTVKDLCDKYREQFGLNIKYHKNNSQLGMAGNTNMGIKLASGELIKILYQDDFLYSENSLQEIVDNFEGQWMVTSCVHTTDGINFQKPFHPRYNDKIYTGNNTIGSPSVLTIKNDNPLLFDENLTWVLDCDYYKRMFDKFGEPKILNEINIVIRLSKYQTSSQLNRSIKKKEINYLIKRYQ